MAETLPSELKDQIATVQTDPHTFTYLNIMRPNDDTLLTRGLSKGLRIYDEIERDCHVFSVLQKRKLAMISRSVIVEPASTSLRDRKAAEWIDAELKRLPFDLICVDLLDALLKGYAVAEIMWEVADGAIRINQVIARDQRRFAFDVDSKPQLLSRSNPWPGVPVIDRKFIIHRYGAKDGNPYGLGLGTRIFWPAFFKRQGLQYWLTFADKFGSPTAVGKYPAGTSPADQQVLLQALGALSQDAGVIIPDGMLIEYLEAARSGSINTYETLCRYMDEEISKAVLGETLSTTHGKGSSSLAATKTHNEVRLELVKADADLLSDTLATLSRWLCEFNFPGATPPRIKRDCDEAEDLDTRADRDTKICSMGFKPTLDYIINTYGDGWEVAPKPVAPPPQLQPQQDSGENFAEPNTDEQAIITGADTLGGDYANLLGKRVESILALLEETKDLVLFKEQLSQLLGDDAMATATEAITRARFSAHLAGRTSTL